MHARFHRELCLLVDYRAKFNGHHSVHRRSIIGCCKPRNKLFIFLFPESEISFLHKKHILLLSRYTIYFKFLSITPLLILSRRLKIKYFFFFLFQSGNKFCSTSRGKNEGKLRYFLKMEEYGKSIDKGITMTNNADRVIVIALY